MVGSNYLLITTYDLLRTTYLVLALDALGYLLLTTYYLLLTTNLVLSLDALGDLRTGETVGQVVLPAGI